MQAHLKVFCQTQWAEHKPRLRPHAIISQDFFANRRRQDPGNVPAANGYSRAPVVGFGADSEAEHMVQFLQFAGLDEALP